MISTMSACSRTSPSVSIAGVQARFGTRVMASRMVSVTANPTLYWTERPRLPLVFAVFILVIQSSSSWEYPAPSTRINRLLRCGAGMCAIASLNSEWAITIVASTSSTTRSFGNVLSATRAAGSPPGSSSHTRLRVLARAAATRFAEVSASSSNARHTVDGDATGPSTWSW